MKQVVFAVPGDLSTPTGGYVYDRRIVAELAKSGWQVEVLDHRRELSARLGRASLRTRICSLPPCRPAA